METRELFWGLQSAGTVAFYIIGFSAIGVSILGIVHSIKKYMRGRASPVPLDLWRGVRRMVADMLSHRTVRRRDTYAGTAHAAIFFGFVILFIGTSTITLDYDIVGPMFGVSFWKGWFFLGFSLTMDIAGLAVALGLIAMMVRRVGFRLPKLDYRRTYRGETDLRPPAKMWRAEDWIFLGGLLLIVLTGFFQEGLRHALESPPWGHWEPIGRLIGSSMLALGVGPSEISSLRSLNWWLHGLGALMFVAALPWYKAKHMIAALGSLTARDPLALRRLPRVVDDGVTEIGIGNISEFSWKDMLDLDACTKCGRCHEACPARAAGYPLSPRDFILDLREHNNHAQGCKQEKDLFEGGVISPDTLWACRMCGACLEICPVGVEHPVKILQMRRRLIENDELDPLLRNVLNTISTSGNSFGEPARKRSAWTSELEFAVKDVRKEAADLLWFVGDQASFDPRNQHVSRTVARLFRAARVDFGLLHDGERTAGNDVRRVGEEGLFESLVEHNMDQMSRAQPFDRIVTTDPHSYNTLRNEYPEFGAMAPVVHYTEILCELLNSGALKVAQPLGLKVTYHDPCHLGRLNKGYGAPRKLLELIGCELIEMPRSRDNSFCCGAGGGRFWIPDAPGTTKPSELRLQEAAKLGCIDVFVTCCPKDLTMFEDARKTAGLEEEFVVEDIAELVARAIKLDEFDLRDLPDLMDKIATSVAERVMVSVNDRLDAWLQEHGSKIQAIRYEAPDIPVTGTLPETQQITGESVQSSLRPTWTASVVAPIALRDYAAPAKEGIRIIVPIKQTGTLSEDFQFSPDGLSIKPEYFEYILNEWDDTALEQALQFTEQQEGGEVVVVTVGPPEAEGSMRKALGKGAHRGVRIWDDSLADADPITIARVLAGLILEEKPDLVITGAQSADLAQSATGVALARLLDLPSAAFVIKAQWDGASELLVTRELEGGIGHSISVPMPALITMQTGANSPRYATMRMIKQAKTKPIENVEIESLDESSRAAVVRELRVPIATRAEMFEGKADEIAANIIKVIQGKMGAKT